MEADTEKNEQINNEDKEDTDYEIDDDERGVEIPRKPEGWDWLSKVNKPLFPCHEIRSCWSNYIKKKQQTIWFPNQHVIENILQIN